MACYLCRPSTLATNADPADRAAWLEDMFLPPDAFDWPLNVLVVRSGDQTILVDAGLGGQFPGFPRAGHFPQRLEAAGIDLASVTDVVITHMHMDHVGGLLVDEVKARLRPDLRIHVAAAEVEFWTIARFLPHLHAGTGAGRASFDRQAIRERLCRQLRTFEEEYEVAPGVVVWRTGGHTPGHSVVRVTSGGDRLTFAGDAMFPVGFDHPDWHNGFEHDPEESVRVRVRLLRERRRPASCWWPPTCRSLPSAGWRSMATPFAGCRLLGLLTRITEGHAPDEVYEEVRGELLHTWKERIAPQGAPFSFTRALAPSIRRRAAITPSPII